MEVRHNAFLYSLTACEAYRFKTATAFTARSSAPDITKIHPVLRIPAPVQGVAAPGIAVASCPAFHLPNSTGKWRRADRKENLPR